MLYKLIKSFNPYLFLYGKLRWRWNKLFRVFLNCIEKINGSAVT